MQGGVAFRGQAIAHLGDGRVVCTGGTISASGMELLSSQPARLGQFVRVAFQLEEGGQWLDVDALLISQASAAQGYSWGFQFQTVPPHVAALIAQHIEGGSSPAQSGTQPLRSRRGPSASQPPVVSPSMARGLRPAATGPQFPAIGAPRSGTEPLRRVPTGPELPVGAPARTGTQPLPPLRRVPTGPHPPIVAPPPKNGAPPTPTGSGFTFTAAPAPRSGGTQPSARRVPVTASPAQSSRRTAKPRQEADEDGLSDLYAEAVDHVEAEEAKRKEEAAKQKKEEAKKK